MLPGQPELSILFRNIHRLPEHRFRAYPMVCRGSANPDIFQAENSSAQCRMFFRSDNVASSCMGFFRFCNPLSVFRRLRIMEWIFRRFPASSPVPEHRSTFHAFLSRRNIRIFSTHQRIGIGLPHGFAAGSEGYSGRNIDRKTFRKIEKKPQGLLAVPPRILWIPGFSLSFSFFLLLPPELLFAYHMP